MRKHIAIIGLALAFLIAQLIGCAEKTVGQQFRDIMAQIDAQCRADKLGPYLDKNDPDYRSKMPRTDCDILKIKPTDPLVTEEGRFAYAIKLPSPHDQPKVQYRKGMSAEAYFKELCEKEAGEWVFRTVKGVEGVFQGRRNISPNYYSSLVFQMYEANEVLTQNMEDSLVQPPFGTYAYMERPADENETKHPYVRLYRGRPVSNRPALQYHSKDGIKRAPYIVNSEPIINLKSSYGFTWRQITNRDQLENGIAGGETIIYNRTTNEVLAFRRFFFRYWPRADTRYTRLTNSDSCHHPSFPKGVDAFIQSVLLPTNSAQ